METLGIEDNELTNEIKIYPNPTKSELFISLQRNQGNQMDYQLFGFSGKLIQKKTMRVTEPIISLDISQLSPGVYIIKIDINGKKWSSQFIKE